MQLKLKFAKEVRKARKQLKLTQEQLAEKVLLSTRSIQYIEAGTWMPKPETLLRLMIVLKLSAEEFTEEVGLSAALSPDMSPLPRP